MKNLTKVLLFLIVLFSLNFCSNTESSAVEKDKKFGLVFKCNTLNELDSLKINYEFKGEKKELYITSESADFFKDSLFIISDLESIHSESVLVINYYKEGIEYETKYSSFTVSEVEKPGGLVNRLNSYMIKNKEVFSEFLVVE